MAPSIRKAHLTLLVLAHFVPTTGFNLLPGLGRPSFGVTRHGTGALPHQSCRSRVAMQSVLEKNPGPGFGLALMDPPYEAKDEAAKREFELNRGQAVDTLLSDYPSIFSQTCDFAPFHENIVLRDTQGFSVEGIRAYRAFFSVVPTLVNVAFSKGEISALLMDKYGIDKSHIKIRWRMDLYPRTIGASLRDAYRWFDTDGDGFISQEEFVDGQERLKGSKTLHAPPKKNVDALVVEGISVYTLNAKGKITQHEIEVTSPTDYPFLEALRELVPVQRQGTFNQIPNCITAEPDFLAVQGVAAASNAHAHAMLMAAAAAAAAPGLQLQGSALAATKTFPQGPGDGDDKDGGGGLAQELLFKIGGKQLAGKFKVPKQCKTDYDCNEGGYNWPLICADFVFAKLCIDPDDNFGGGLGALNWGPGDLVAEPIPVRVEDGWLN
jgi:hypothetical protein